MLNQQFIRYVSEGTILDLKSQIIHTLNGTAKQIVDHAYKYLPEKDTAGQPTVVAWYIDDIDDSIKSVQVEIQLGNNQRINDSQVMTVEVSDTSNIKVILTEDMFAIMSQSIEGMDRYNSFESVEEAIGFLDQLYSKLL